QIGPLVARLVPGQRLLPVDLAEDGLGVGIDEQLVRVAPVPARGRVGAVHAEAVEGARLQLRQVAVPGVPGDIGEIEAFKMARRSGRVVEANLDPRRHVRVEGEIDAAAVERGAPWEGRTRPDLAHSEST